MRTFASQGLTPQIVISYPISSHLHHICASSYLRFLSQISTSSLSSSGLHILRPHLVFTRSDLHRRVTLSLSYHLQDFIVQLLSQLYNLIYLRLQNFISPRSRANRRLVDDRDLFIRVVGEIMAEFNLQQPPYNQSPQDSGTQRPEGNDADNKWIRISGDKRPLDHLY